MVVFFLKKNDHISALSIPSLNTHSGCELYDWNVSPAHVFCFIRTSEIMSVYQKCWCTKPCTKKMVQIPIYLKNYTICTNYFGTRRLMYHYFWYIQRHVPVLTYFKISPVYNLTYHFFGTYCNVYQKI